MNSLDARSQILLKTLIERYIADGQPVGSRALSRFSGLELSPATVRNVMADLEELGLLEQRHTSAGRVPTPTGLRFFIDAMLKVRGLSPAERDDIRQRVRTGPPEEVLPRVSRLLSDLTHHAAVIIAPDPSRQRFSHLEFVPLRGGKVLVIMVATDGRIENRLLPWEQPIDPPRLERIHNYLNDLLSGMTLDEVKDAVRRELGVEKNQYDQVVAEALRLGEAAFVQAPERSAEVLVAGHANLLDDGDDRPDTGSRMRDLLHTLDTKETLLRLLDETRNAEGIRVFLGAETAVSALEGSSVVAGSYGPDETPLGALAVIGPMRMNYGKVMSVVDFTAEVVSEILAGAVPPKP